MSRLFTLSGPMRPRFESAPYRQSPGRREHIYGRVHSLGCDCRACRGVVIIQEQGK